MNTIPMDTETARESLRNYSDRKPSEIGEAVDVLYPIFRTYKAIAAEFGRSDKYWSMRHRLFQLPKGIRWKIDEGQISTEQGYQISRLKNEEDQWLLAVAIIENQDLTVTVSDCENVVNLVLKENKLIREALSISAGIRFHEIYSLGLVLRFDIRLEVYKVAWARHCEWADLCYRLIRQGLDVDLEVVACQLEKLASDLRKAGATEQESVEPEEDNAGNQVEIQGF